ncbi:hypothetical protein ACJJTC_010770 [Scirpophaga incertulas]
MGFVSDGDRLHKIRTPVILAIYSPAEAVSKAERYEENAEKNGQETFQALFSFSKEANDSRDPSLETICMMVFRIDRSTYIVVTRTGRCSAYAGKCSSLYTLFSLCAILNKYLLIDAKTLAFDLAFDCRLDEELKLAHCNNTQNLNAMKISHHTLDASG